MLVFVLSDMTLPSGSRRACPFSSTSAGAVQLVIELSKQISSSVTEVMMPTYCLSISSFHVRVGAGASETVTGGGGAGVGFGGSMSLPPATILGTSTIFGTSISLMVSN